MAYIQRRKPSLPGVSLGKRLAFSLASFLLRRSSILDDFTTSGSPEDIAVTTAWQKSQLLALLVVVWPMVSQAHPLDI